MRVNDGNATVVNYYLKKNILHKFFYFCKMFCVFHQKLIVYIKWFNDREKPPEICLRYSVMIALNIREQSIMV